MPRLSLLTHTLGAVLLSYGLLLFAFGPCLTALAETFDIPLGRTGLIFTMFSAGLIPSVLLVACVSEAAGKRLVLLISTALLAIGCGLFGAVPSLGARPSFSLALGVVVLMGVGGGGLETLTNVIIADDNQPAPGFALNWAHAFFALGAVLGPMVVGLLFKARLPWQLAFYGAGALLAVVFVVLLPQRMPSAQDAPFSRGAALRLLRAPLLWVLLIAIGLYVGAEVGLTAWVSPLMERALGSARGTAGLAVSVFWVFMIVGRLATSALSTRLRPVPLVVGLAAASALASAAVARSPSVVWCLVSSAASGLFMSGIFGLILTDAARRFPASSTPVFGLLIAGVGAGALVAPAAMGWVGSISGLPTAMLIPPGLMVAVTLLYLVLWPVEAREGGAQRGWKEWGANRAKGAGS